MADWIVDRVGAAHLILDEHSFRRLDGRVSAWLFGNGVYSTAGEHTGWFEHGFLFDIDNEVVGLLAQICAPELLGELPPSMPAFPRRPHVPLLRARQRRPQSLPAGAVMSSLAMSWPALSTCRQRARAGAA
jgi:hypothetical protein